MNGLVYATYYQNYQQINILQQTIPWRIDRNLQVGMYSGRFNIENTPEYNITDIENTPEYNITDKLRNIIREYI